MVEPIANFIKASRKATRDDMEAHEVTLTRLIPSTGLSTDLLQSI